MTEYTSSTGIVRDFTLDLDRILKMEEESPGYENKKYQEIQKDIKTYEMVKKPFQMAFRDICLAW